MDAARRRRASTALPGDEAGQGGQRVGIKSFFSKEGRQSRQIGRWARTVANPKAAGEDRWAAMLDLAKEGSPESIMALLMRYTYTAEVGTRSRVTDEQEKNLVHDLVTELGELALGPVKEFLLSELGPPGQPKQSISFGLRILDAIAPSSDAAWAVLLEVIEANEPGYERDPNRKIELLTFLGEWERRPEITEAILPYLEDADDGVRFHTAEALLRQGQEACKEPLLTVLREEDESYQMRNRILSGFIVNGWLEDVLPFMEDLDEPGLNQATEALVELPDAPMTRELLLKIAESSQASERIRSRVAEWFVISGASTHGIRGRLERMLPRGYKVAKKRVDRFPEAMREPYLGLAVEGLLELEDPDVALEPLVRLLRNKALGDSLYIRAVEFLVMRAWPVGKLDKATKKALPPGYRVGEAGVVERVISEMDEPFLTAAGDNLLDHGDPEDPAVIEQMMLIIAHNNSDERVRERLCDRFDREQWSVLGHEREVERKLPKEFKLNVLDHGRDYQIVRVLARI